MIHGCGLVALVLSVSPDPAATDAEKAAQAGQASITQARTPDQVLEAYLALNPTAFVTATRSSPPDVAAEAIQILGKIAVDRKTERAYQSMKRRLESWLGCASEPTGHFAHTCAALAPLRMQELASSAQALETALLSDALAAVGAKISSGFAMQAWDTFRTNLVPLLLHPNRTIAPQAVDGLVQQVLSLGLRASGTKKYCDLGPPERALTLEATAVIQCRSAGGNLADCPVGLVADSLAQAAACPVPLSEQTQGLARSIAQNLVVALTAKAGEGGARARLEHGADALLQSACVAAGVVACDEVSAGTPLWMGLLRAGVHAALEQDTNALVAIAFQALVQTDASLDSATVADRKRGLSVVAALLDSAETFTQPPTDGMDTDRRTRILESLTHEMTGRAGREKDCLFSFGGALRSVSGGRFASGSSAFWGPLALPLGVGFQGPTTASGLGFHAELDALDVGQYVSFDGAGQVQKPSLEDALTFTAGVGLYLGRELPVTLTALGGFSPHYQFATGGSRGAWNVGLGLGVYVPLLDLN